MRHYIPEGALNHTTIKISRLTTRKSVEIETESYLYTHHIIKYTNMDFINMNFKYLSLFPLSLSSVMFHVYTLKHCMDTVFSTESSVFNT
jgi:hypothetical protein